MRDLSRILAAGRQMVKEDDGGAIAVLVAMLLSTGVLLGMAALVVDVGVLNAEQAQLQNGADAGALAVAKSCALGACSPDLAPGYVTQNVKSGLAEVQSVCGSPFLVLCPVNCPLPSLTSNYVDVLTSSEAADNSTLVPPVFAGALLGRNFHGTTVYACAQASWGAPAAAQATAITISKCSWNLDTSYGTLFAPPPAAGSPAPAADLALPLLRGTNSGCRGTHPSGTFGWTIDQTGTCSRYIAGTSYPASTNGAGCEPALAIAQASGTPLVIPVFASVGHSSYTLKGFAAFVVTGYRLPGFAAPDWLNPAKNCAAGTTCINGYFTRELIPTTGVTGGQDLGASIVELTG